MTRKPILNISGLSKTFPEKNILSLQQIDVAVYKNEFLCILGPNGCGKSTLLNLIGGFKPYFPPTKGRILVNGVEISGPDKNRAMVFQEQTLFPWLTVQDNIAFGLKMNSAPKADRQSVSEHYLKLMKLEAFRDKYPHQLSGGMKQKTELARALALRPEILLLDEPFAQVDALSRLNLREELLMVTRQEKITVVLVTHSIEEAVFLGDRICVMTGRPGRIKQEVNVDLPKGKPYKHMVTDSRFLQLRNFLADILEEDS